MSALDIMEINEFPENKNLNKNAFGKEKLDVFHLNQRGSSPLSAMTTLDLGVPFWRPSASTL